MRKYFTKVNFAVSQSAQSEAKQAKYKQGLLKRETEIPKLEGQDVSRIAERKIDVPS